MYAKRYIRKWLYLPSYLIINHATSQKAHIMNVYKIDEPAVISFSGGRTSAYMLWKILKAYDGKLPENIKVCFANTGKEMPQTLDFVRDCSERWGVDVVWLERYARETTEIERESKKNKYIYETRVVNYETAARNGEPFRALVKARRYAPNPVARFCTAELKVRAISCYLEEVCGFEKPYAAFLGIRGDERRRAAKMLGTLDEGQERLLPLYREGIIAMDISEFWKAQDFDLQLPNNNGVTDWGNCDLCFLKGYGKKQSIIREKPELADWWIELEQELSEEVGKGAYFRADQPSYKEMKRLALEQTSLFEYEDDETIPCFCGD